MKLHDLLRISVPAVLPLGAAVAALVPTAAAFQGSDSCSAAQPLVGQTTFTIDTTQATTGSAGQGGQVPCAGGALAGIEKDVWFWWAAGTSGEVTVSTCAGPGFDTKIQVFAGTGCPATVAIACSDDECGTRAAAHFYAEYGQLYTFQIGSKPGTPGGIVGGTITVTTPNNCSSPIEITGRGSFPFDNTLATSGSAGQFESACDHFGTTAIDHDVWYLWTAPSTGTATLSTCNLTVVDTKVAVYPASAIGCPTAAAIACDDDACGYQSRVSFPCVAQVQYLIQLGTYATSPGGTGAFRIDLEGADCAYDDGHAEGSWGNQNGGTTVWLQKFGVPGETTVLSTVSVAYGQTATPGFAPPNGTPATIAIWDDPNDDGHPIDAVLVRTQASAIDNVDTDVLNVTNLIPPVSVRGVYFVGVSVAHGPMKFPIPLDMTASAPNGRCWFLGSASASVDLSNMSAYGVFEDLDVTYPGTRSLLVRAGCDPATGIYDYCHSSAPGYACSALGMGCSNGIAGHGCANSANPNGAMLAAIGSPSVQSDSVRLIASGLPSNSSALFFQSTSPGGAPTPFGDGLRCAAGSVIRLATKTASMGGSTQFGYGVASDPQVHVRGLVGAATTRYYQVWYRNAASFCTSSTFNLSNGLAIEWQ